MQRPRRSWRRPTIGCPLPVAPRYRRRARDIAGRDLLQPLPQPLIDALHELSPRVLRKCQRLSRPGGGVQVGAEGSNGGKVLGIVMPGGPLCAVAGAEPTFAPNARTATPSQMTRRITMLPGNILPPMARLLPSGRTDFRYQGFWIRRQ